MCAVIFSVKNGVVNNSGDQVREELRRVRVHPRVCHGEEPDQGRSARVAGAAPLGSEVKLLLVVALVQRRRHLLSRGRVQLHHGHQRTVPLRLAEDLRR